MKRIIVISLLLSFILTTSGSWGYKPLEHRVGVTFSNGAHISAEVVDTKPATQRGLMYRDVIGQDEGMFFVFDHEDTYAFWMKNMNFPLDIIWLDSSYKIVHIEREVPPCDSETCTLYTPSKPARYVLETRAGFYSSSGINVGDGITLSS
ncbi:MAG: DUF192 domain-containing protein [Candidatus Hydrothermarchaeales archaeon]